MYSPQLGRFLNPDPLTHEPTLLYDNNWFGDQLTLMRTQYGYAGNNPVNYTDPSGLMVYSPPVEVGKCPQSEEGKTKILTQTSKRTIGPRSETAYLPCSVKVTSEQNCIKVEMDFPGTMKCTRTATYIWSAGSKWVVSCVNGIRYLISSDDPRGKNVKIDATPWKCGPCIINYPKPYPVGGKPPYQIA